MCSTLNLIRWPSFASTGTVRCTQRHLRKGYQKRVPRARHSAQHCRPCCLHDGRKEGRCSQGGCTCDRWVFVEQVSTNVAFAFWLLCRPINRVLCYRKGIGGCRLNADWHPVGCWPTICAEQFAPWKCKQLRKDISASWAYAARPLYCLLCRCEAFRIGSCALYTPSSCWVL